MTSFSLSLLGTNTATYIASGRSKAARQKLKDAMEHATVAISSISEAEILLRLENKLGAARLRATVEELLEVVQILAWDSAAVQTYGKLRARLASENSLSAMDMLIAAHAAANDANRLTRWIVLRGITTWLLRNIGTSSD